MLYVFIETNVTVYMHTAVRYPEYLDIVNISMCSYRDKFGFWSCYQDTYDEFINHEQECSMNIKSIYEVRCV